LRVRSKRDADRQAIVERRSEFVLASKYGRTGVGTKRVINGRPQTLPRTLEEALARQRSNVILLLSSPVALDGAVNAVGIRAGLAPLLRRLGGWVALETYKGNPT
jgi:hypothetical protein